jgi:hemerythrin-like domain-containing protein
VHKCIKASGVTEPSRAPSCLQRSRMTAGGCDGRNCRHPARGTPKHRKVAPSHEEELSVFDRGERPDYEVFLAVVEFFHKYPDSCHHPKEDIIYEKFKARAPDRAAIIPDLEAEHRDGAARLRRVAQAIDAVLNDQEVLRDDVDRIVREFIDNERKHIALEDKVVFPAILDALQPADWADIAMTLADRYGPPSEADFEEQFSTARRNILELEEAAAARRL